MPADKELTKKITHRDIKKTVKSFALPNDKMCKSGDAWELAILCPGKKDDKEPELIGNFGTAMNGWVHEARKSTLKEVDWYIHTILRKNRVYQIVPVDFEGKHIKLSEKQKYKPFAYDIFSRPKPKNIGNYGGGGLYYNCIHHRGSGKCTHPVRSDPRRSGHQGCMCRYTSKTEQKCPDYFGSNPYYSHDKGGKK